MEYLLGTANQDLADQKLLRKSGLLLEKCLQKTFFGALHVFMENCKTRLQHLRIFRRKVHGKTSKTSFSNLENFHPKPHDGTCVCRFPNCPYGYLSNALRLRRVLKEYFGYYHDSRTHLGLDKDTSELRVGEPVKIGAVVKKPVLGGLHHRYYRKAA